MTDGFGHDDGEFLRFLNVLENNFERIVLLGDIWETLTGRFPGQAEYELLRARRSHAQIAARFRRPKYSYVHGNHDLIAERVDKAPSELFIEADGVRLLFMHGHQNDTLIEERRWLSELGVWLGGWLRRLGLEPLYRWFEELDSLRSGASLNAQTCPFQKWAVNVAERLEADVMITGHTHLATRAEHGNRLFMNSGSCSGGKFSFLSLDTRRGQYGVHNTF